MEPDRLVACSGSSTGAWRASTSKALNFAFRNAYFDELVVCNVENDSGLSYRNEAGRPPPNLPLVRGRDFQRYRFQCYSPLGLPRLDPRRA